MKEDFQNIDSLINEHTNRQLSAVDWDRLYSRIQKRLDNVEKRTDTISTKRGIFRWAVGIASAAAALFIVFTLMDNRKRMLSLPAGQQAVVRLSEQHSAAKIEKTIAAAQVSIVIEPSAEQTQVCISQPEHRIAQCTITIIDQNGHSETENAPHPSWIMMMASKPTPAENKTDKDQLDIACLL